MISHTEQMGTCERGHNCEHEWPRHAGKPRHPQRAIWRLAARAGRLRSAPNTPLPPRWSGRRTQIGYTRWPITSLAYRICVRRDRSARDWKRSSRNSGPTLRAIRENSSSWCRAVKTIHAELELPRRLEPAVDLLIGDLTRAIRNTGDGK